MSEETYLFVIKYYGKSEILAEGETVTNTLEGLASTSNKLEFKAVDDGVVGIVKLLPSEIDDFFHEVRAITARINGVSKAIAEGRDAASAGQLVNKLQDNSFAKWARISFTDLVKCFTFIAQPKKESDINDYCIVPTELHDLLATLPVEDLLPAKDPSTGKLKPGMLGGIGGHSGG